MSDLLQALITLFAIVIAGGLLFYAVERLIDRRLGKMEDRDD